MLARRALLFAALAAFGCAHGSPQPGRPTTHEAAPVKPRVKLAILPVESDAFPHLAAGINTQFHDVQLTGIDDYFISKVTLEVVQLSIECTDATPECLGSVGKSLSAQRLLYGHITSTAKKPTKRKVPVTVTVTLFDVDKGATVAEASRQFKSEGEATLAIGGVLKEVVAGATGGGGAATATASGSAAR